MNRNVRALHDIITYIYVQQIDVFSFYLRIKLVIQLYNLTFGWYKFPDVLLHLLHRISVVHNAHVTQLLFSECNIDWKIIRHSIHVKYAFQMFLHLVTILYSSSTAFSAWSPLFFWVWVFCMILCCYNSTILYLYLLYIHNRNIPT